MNSPNSSSSHGSDSPDAESNLRFPSDIMKSLWEDEASKNFAFEVEGRIVRCHRIVLENASDYFKDLLDKQSALEKGSHIKIIVEEMKFETIHSVIRFFYTNEIYLDDSCVFDILKAANRFKIQNLYERCQCYLEHCISPVICWELLHLTKTETIWKGEALKKVALEYIAIHPVACEIVSFYNELSWDEFHFIVTTANDQTYNAQDCKALISALQRIIRSFDIRNSGRTVINELLNVAIPIFERCMCIENAVELFFLGYHYGCQLLREISIKQLDYLWCSEKVLCQLDGPTFEIIINEIYESKCNKTIYDRNVSRLALQTKSSRECGETIWLWLEQNKARIEDCKRILYNFREHVSEALKRTNVLKVFRMSRSYKCSEIEKNCLSFMRENMCDLVNVLIDTSEDEIEAISRFHSYPRRLNRQQEGKVMTFRQLKHRKLFSGENVFISLKKFLESWNSELRCGPETMTTQNKVVTPSARRPWPRMRSSLTQLKRGERSMGTLMTRLQLEDDRPTSARRFQNDFGKLLGKWILQNEGKCTDDCINELLERHFVEIAEDLSSKNVEKFYVMAIRRKQMELEALCFSYLLNNFKESLDMILNLSFSEFSRLVFDILKLFKEDVLVKVCLGQVTTYWMADISDDLNNIAQRNLKGVYRRKLKFRDGKEDEAHILEKLGFLIDAMLQNMDLSNCLLSALKISSKLDGKQSYKKILELCIEMFPTIIKDGKFVELSSAIVLEMIQIRKLRFDTHRERSELSEQDMMDALIKWFKRPSYKVQEEHSDRKESLKKLFISLNLQNIPFENLLGAFECFPFLLEHEQIQEVFLKQCRKNLTDMYFKQRKKRP